MSIRLHHHGAVLVGPVPPHRSLVALRTSGTGGRSDLLSPRWLAIWGRALRRTPACSRSGCRGRDSDLRRGWRRRGDVAFDGAADVARGTTQTSRQRNSGTSESSFHLLPLPVGGSRMPRDHVTPSIGPDRRDRHSPSEPRPPASPTGGPSTVRTAARESPPTLPAARTRAGSTTRRRCDRDRRG